MALICSNCRKELPNNAKFCGDCGTTVVVQKKKPNYCANCFAELPEDVKFCLQCGKPAVIAQYPLDNPQRDKTIYDELLRTSPEQVKSRKREAVYKATGKYPTGGEEIEDFEQNKAIIVQRASKWAEYQTSKLERIHWFQEFSYRTLISSKIQASFRYESSWFPTNKPNYHKALFYEEIIGHYLFEFSRQGVLAWDDPPQPTPLFFDYLKKVVGVTEKDIKEFDFKLPDTFNMEAIRVWVDKDDELFPPPQQIRVEVAGTILNFTTDEAVLVVYVDCAYKGKTVAVENFSELSIWFDYPDHKAEIRERAVDNTVYCAAIFNHIPFVTNKFRHDQKALTQMDCTIRSTIPAGFENRWEETVTLFRGQVTELDWRRRKA
jgi:Double zinc ribbon